MVKQTKDLQSSFSEPALFKLVVVEGRVELGRSHSLIVYLTFRGDISLDQMAGQKVGMQAARGVPRVEKCSGTTQAVQHRQCNTGSAREQHSSGSNNFIRRHTARLLLTFNQSHSTHSHPPHSRPGAQHRERYQAAMSNSMWICLI